MTVATRILAFLYKSLSSPSYRYPNAERDFFLNLISAEMGKKLNFIYNM